MPNKQDRRQVEINTFESKPKKRVKGLRRGIIAIVCSVYAFTFWLRAFSAIDQGLSTVSPGGILFGIFFILSLYLVKFSGIIVTVIFANAGIWFGILTIAEFCKKDDQTERRSEWVLFMGILAILFAVAAIILFVYFLTYMKG